MERRGRESNEGKYMRATEDEELRRRVLENVDALSLTNRRLRNRSYRSPFNISLPPTIKRKPQNILSSMEKKKLPWIDTRWLSTVNYGQLIEGKPIFRWTSNQGTIVGRLDTFYQWLITEDRLNFSFSCAFLLIHRWDIFFYEIDTANMKNWWSREDFGDVLWFYN